MNKIKYIASPAAWLPFRQWPASSRRFPAVIDALLLNSFEILASMKSLRLPWNLLWVCNTDAWRLAGVRSWSSEKPVCGGGCPSICTQRHSSGAPGSGALQGTHAHPGGWEERAANKKYPDLSIASPRWRAMENKGSILFQHTCFHTYLECQWDAMTRPQSVICRWFLQSAE